MMMKKPKERQENVVGPQVFPSDEILDKARNFLQEEDEK